MVANKYQMELKELKERVVESRKSDKKNRERFYQMKNFILNSNLTNEDKALLAKQKKPAIEANFLEAYGSRLIGEFAKQTPGIVVNPLPQNQMPQPEMNQVLESHLRYHYEEACRRENLAVQLYKDYLYGGFSNFKVITEYEPYSFDQVIRWKKVFDPTMVGHDYFAEMPTKIDGEYSFEIYPFRLREFQKQYPNIRLDDIQYSKSLDGYSFAYTNSKDKIILLCEIYKRNSKSVKIVQLSNGQVMKSDDYKKMVEEWSSFIPPPNVHNERYEQDYSIDRYTFIQNQVIDHEKTIYKYLPHVFVGGGEKLRESDEGELVEMTRSYFHNAVGIQRLSNYALQNLANELENLLQQKWKIAEEALPNQPDYLNALINNQIPSVLIYKAFSDDDPNQPLPEPQEIQRMPAPPEITQALDLCNKLGQSILGTYDASLGITKNELSGIAILEGATQSNAAAMPFVDNIMQAITGGAIVSLDLYPKIYATPRTIPVTFADGKKGYLPINQTGMPNFKDLDTNALQVSVEAGVNFSIQKSRALNQIIQMANAMPIFGEFAQYPGVLEVLLDNLEIHGIDELKELAQQFLQQKAQAAQQAAQQPQLNPMMLKQQELMMKDKHQQQDFMLQQARIQNENLNTQLDASTKHNQYVASLAKVLAERFNDETKAEIEHNKLQHEKNMDHLDLAHKIVSEHARNRG